ncbi:Gfo/Idh/MocA family protein [Pedobacter caeni]|uniref:Predicted dehydrogenase n=1 Tax=Pedobacter caeni TaxID=288992 RepID=A0A1M4TL71_9SPHI|nr:Gfo/Idh/MocA family oxidoreductase [Pedobacter caeni]SHE45146.1 Predicted dehydrogenase [Pedobacter caeni]
MNRRHFCANGLVGLAGLTLMPEALFANTKDKVRLGYIGVGLRGRNHISEGLLRDDVEITAICDTQESSLKHCRAQFVKAGKKLPVEYTGGINAYKKLLERKDIDAVIIATPWEFHKDQAIDAMRAGKYVGCEVIAGITVEDHWEILTVYEETNVPYMTLENVSYRRDVLAVLNMVRNNVFGELVHLEGGYQHDLRGVLFNDGVNFDGKGGEFGPNAVGEAQWRTQWNADRNGDIYPTHGAGPIMNYININCGNQFTNLVSFASKSKGLHQYIKKVSPGNKNLSVNFKNGDLITTMLNCANGETVTLTHDTHLPRPYSLGFRVQGTEGLWMDVADSIYVEGKSGTYDEWDKAKVWLDKYDHPLWKKYEHLAEGAGHGGMDWFVFNAFVESVKQKKQTPIDIYDSLTMSVITPLSEQSLTEGNMPQKFPDFTKGKWKTAKSKFALDNSGF